MHMGVLSAFMNVYHVHHRNQKMAWDSLEVMFQTVTSSHVGAGNQTQSPGRAASALTSSQSCLATPEVTAKSGQIK